jgi:hypothetical protein
VLARREKDVGVEAKQQDEDVVFALPENSMSVHLPRNKLRNVRIPRITKTSNFYLLRRIHILSLVLISSCRCIGVLSAFYVEKQCPQMRALLPYCETEPCSEDIPTGEFYKKFANWE